MAPYEYPSDLHRRRHGPYGYNKYQQYKRWLRDDFTFQCVYCLTREKWCEDGHRGFTVDHLIPKSHDSELECDYDNLVYACAWCNTLKGTELLLNPCEMPFGAHLSVDGEANVQTSSKEGKRLVEKLRLDSKDRTDFRRRVLELLILLQRLKSAPAQALLQRWLGFPEDLPDLKAPPHPIGNTRSEGIEESWFQRRERGDLPATY